MALTTEEQKLLDFARGMLPAWFTDNEREMEFLAAAAKLIGAAQLQTDDWFTNALITTAVGATATDPDWLNQHAVDRGTTRQDGETDVALRGRLRSVEDALTRPTILAAAQAIVDAEGIVGTVSMVELRKDQAYFGTYQEQSGTGGEFAETGPGSGIYVFTPDVAFQRILQFPSSTHFGTPQLVISGAANAGNDGTFPITAVNGNGVEFANGSGVDAVDATASWQLQKRNVEGFVWDGKARYYMGRGYRMHGNPRNKFLIILPFGCTAGTRASVLEMLRQKKGAGTAVEVECRAIP